MAEIAALKRLIDETGRLIGEVLRHGERFGVDRDLLVVANNVNTLIPAANKALARLEGMAAPGKTTEQERVGYAKR